MKTFALIFFLLFTSTLSLYAQIPNYIPTNGLVGWWPFNGNANDESGNGNNGTVNGPTLTTDRFGVANKAYSFDGINDFIQMLYAGPAGNVSVTVSFWIKTTMTVNTSASGGVGYVFSYGANNVSQMGQSFNISVNGSAWVNSCNQSITFDTYGAALAKTVTHANTWDFYTIVNDPQFGSNVINQKIYKNGILLTQTCFSSPGVPVNNTNFSSATPIRIGKYFGTACANCQQSTENHFNGLIDDIGIWNVALTPQEITALYTSTPISTISVNPPSTTICEGSSTTLTATPIGSTPCSSTQLPTNLQSGLVGYWPFCGNANDASFNGNNGSVNGATLTTDRFGNANSAYNFDGVNDIITVPDNSTLDFPNGQFTLAAWVKVNELNTELSFLDHLDNSSPSIYARYELRKLPNNKIRFILKDMGNNFSYIDSDTPINNTNDWYHIAGTFNSTTQTIKLYINGVVQVGIITLQGTSSSITPTGILQFGKYGDLSYSNTKIDDIAMWNRALTASEIQQLYSSGNATYVWTPGGATTPSITVSPATTTTYTCTATVNGQTNSAVSIVNVNSTPIITASTTTICPGDTISLNATTNNPVTTCGNLTGSLSNGLIGYWPFCGNANDLSGNGNNGVVTGASLTTDRFGNANNAYSFDGVNDSISVAPNAAIQLTNSNPLSVQCWFYVNNFSLNGGALISKYKNGQIINSSIFLAPIAPNLLQIGGNGSQAFQTTTFSPNQWNHLVVIYNSPNLNTASVYLNGTFITTLTVSLNTVTNNTPLKFGSTNCPANDPNCNFYNGKLDDIGMWNRALTAAEIQQLFTQGQSSYSWTPGGFTTPTINVTPTVTTTYTCTVTTNGIACSSSQIITVNTLPTVNAGNDQIICSGDQVTLNATGAANYSWTGGVQNGIPFTPLVTGTYVVTGTTNGCTNSDDVNITVQSLPVISANPIAICAGQSTTLSVVSPCPNMTGTLNNNLLGFWPFCGNFDDVSGNGHNGTNFGASFTADRHGNPNNSIYLNGSARVDVGNLNLGNSNSSYTYANWFKTSASSTPHRTMIADYNSNSGDDNIFACWHMTESTNKASTQTRYNANSYGALSLNSVNDGQWHHMVTTIDRGTNLISIFIDGVLINSTQIPANINFNNNGYLRFGIHKWNNIFQPNLFWLGELDDIAIWNRTLSLTEIQQLFNQGQVSYNWQPNGATSSTITVSPTTSTTYTVSVTENGLTCSSSQTITVNPQPSSTITVNGPTAICPSQNVTLCGSGLPNMSYFWCNGATTPCITVNAAGTYCLNVLDSNGCFSDTSYVVITELQGSSSNQVAAACNSYTLNGQTYNQSGVYSQIIPNSAGCDSTITLDLTINTAPATPNVYVQNQTTLSTDNIPGLSYQWFFCTDLIDVPGATNAIFTPTANAFYAVIVSNSCGSDTSDCIDVNSIGLNEFNQQTIELYPNPNNGYFNVSVPSALIGVKIEIRDINGRILRTFIANEEWQEINISDLASGNYWLAIEKNKPIQMIKN